MTGFALRSPWYVRERTHAGLFDAASTRPTLQMYDGTDFVDRILADPRDSLAFGDDDVWSYPVPVTSPSGTGRARLATHELIRTKLRKLYQPNHDRFYAVVVEVLCDQPGLPRAGSHDDIEVGFVVRRQLTTVTGGRRPSRRLARNLLVEMARHQRVEAAVPEPAADVRDVWLADRAWRRRVLEDNRDLVAQLSVTSQDQGWFAGPGRQPQWGPVPPDGVGKSEDGLEEETFPMWRLPARDDDCARARTRSLWFGLVPTYSSDHWATPEGRRPKYDDSAIYEAHCFVRRPRPPGHEHCPPEVWWNDAPTEPFRFASPMDPQGTSKRLTTITLPDLRRLAARAGQPMGPGGVQVITPPGSQFSFNPLDGAPKSGAGAVGGGGQICMFALELFFMVAFFLFLLFLPIVVLAFQLWWMLALRFCIPPSIGFDVTVDFLADAALLSDVQTDATFRADFELEFGISVDVAIDQIFGTDSSGLASSERGRWLAALLAAKDDSGANLFTGDPDFVAAMAQSTDPRLATPPGPPDLESVPDDPLCPS